MDIINTLIEKYFRNKYSIIMAVLIGIIFSIILYFTIPVKCLKILAILCVVGVEIYYIIDTIIYNKLPKNKTDDAILIRIIAKDKKEYDDIKYKFGKEFEKFLKSNENKIKILYIPFHLIEINSYNEKEKIIKLLEKTNCIFLTTIKTRSEDTNESTKYITEFNLGIIHPVYIDKIEKIFQREINILGMPTARVEYSTENKLNILEVTAQRISFICKYIIARAYYLSNELESALCIGEKLYNELTLVSEGNFENIRRCVCSLCYDIHIAKMLIENLKDNKNINYVENELNEANKYIKNTYTYYESMSVCCFLKYRDIKKTNDYIGSCKKINKNGTWKYSVAFLKAYCDESEGKIIYHYKQAFKVPYPHMHLISFIEDILVSEPHKNMLRFALMLLYLQIGEIKTAKGIMKEYIQNKQISNIEENSIEQLKRIYGDRIIKDLIGTN
ncbi:MAG: hypothetical protein IJN50_04140 [Clostridia bacterium]|nr:hypothetical protein [Clostridia bacterium]